MNFIDTFFNTHKPRTITIEGEERQYVVGGKGKTAFLIFPGSGEDALACYDLIDAFEKDYKAIAVNYAGFHSVHSFFNYVNAILRQERVGKVILYGLSIGGFVAQHYVRRFGDKVDKLIISHSGSMRSKTIIRNVVIPAKILSLFLPLIPQSIVTRLFQVLSGRAQSNNKNIIKLYEQYSSEDNLARRKSFAEKTSFSMADKKYLHSIYDLGMDMKNLESKFTSKDLLKWRGTILIMRTDNDHLAKDDGLFKEYYPKAKVTIFKNTGHLTPFIQTEKIIQSIEDFIQTR